MLIYLLYALIILGTHIFFKHHQAIKNIHLVIFIAGILVILLLSLVVSIKINLSSVFVQILTIVLAVAFQERLNHKLE